MTRQLAAFIRRFPAVIHIPYRVFRRVQTRYTVGVVAVILDDHCRVLIVEHLLHPDYPWGLPGGWIGADEDPAAALLRELKEELQLTAVVTQTLHVARSLPNHIDIAFLCQAKGPIGKLSIELLDYKWVEPEALPQLQAFHRRAIEAALNRRRQSR